jgi:hypothetical protein
MPSRKHTAKAELLRLIEENWTTDGVFSSDDIHRFEPRFQRLYPANRHMRNSLNKYLQLLRKDGFIDFIDNRGYYRLLPERKRDSVALG